MNPEEAAKQTAEDTTEEFGVNACAVGWAVLVDNSDKDVVERNLYGYVDTTAETAGLDFNYRRIEHNTDKYGGSLLMVEFY